jgi:hypothetical protein
MHVWLQMVTILPGSRNQAHRRMVDPEEQASDHADDEGETLLAHMSHEHQSSPKGCLIALVLFVNVFVGAAGAT